MTVMSTEGLKGKVFLWDRVPYMQQLPAPMWASFRSFPTIFLSLCVSTHVTYLSLRPY